MKLMLDVSSVTSFSNIGGIQQPVISQRKIEHDIRLKEGEVNLLGGIFEQTDTKTLTVSRHWPTAISKIPFSANENKERIDNEIVFILIRTLLAVARVDRSQPASYRCRHW